MKYHSRKCGGKIIYCRKVNLFIGFIIPTCWIAAAQSGTFPAGAWVLLVHILQTSNPQIHPQHQNNWSFLLGHSQNDVPYFRTSQNVFCLQKGSMELLRMARNIRHMTCKYLRKTFWHSTDLETIMMTQETIFVGISKLFCKCLELWAVWMSTKGEHLQKWPPRRLHKFLPNWKKGQSSRKKLLFCPPTSLGGTKIIFIQWKYGTGWNKNKTKLGPLKHYRLSNCYDWG